MNGFVCGKFFTVITRFSLNRTISPVKGLKHGYTTCDGCREHPLAGTRWKCVDCPNYDLCSPCYMSDVHDKTHTFHRFDDPRVDGVDG